MKARYTFDQCAIERGNASMNEERKNSQTLRILHLEDSPQDAELIRERLIDAGFNAQLDWAANEQEFTAYIEHGGYDLVLADYLLPGFEAPAALVLTRSLCPGLPFIVVSGAVGEEKAVELLKQGVTDYVLKDRLAKLPLAIKRALTEAETENARRLTEEALRESEARYRRIVDTASEGIWVLNSDHRTTFVNKRLAEMLGATSVEMIGRPLTDFMFEEDIPDHLKKMENRRRGQAEQYERRLRRKDGSVLWTLASATPIFEGERHFQGSFGMFTDITERKLAEEELHRLRADLEQRVRERTAELADKNEELEQLNQLFVGRELRMIELKEQVRKLEKKLSI
jgi:PAS domain S-box-containing protein